MKLMRCYRAKMAQERAETNPTWALSMLDLIMISVYLNLGVCKVADRSKLMIREIRQTIVQ